MPPEQQLKQVAILFLDVVGSTRLSQHLDPEDIHAVMDGALARCTQVVQAHHGRVLQYAGDNLLATFGADEAREDDSEQAVRCGLALLALGRALGAEVLAGHGHAGFDVRVGIHTGGVLLGGGVDAEGSIRGIAVNIAARMEQTAPAGALRISAATHAQVRGTLEVLAQEPLMVKGLDEPIHSYLVLSARPWAFREASRGIAGVATRMVGRDAELEALQDAFKRLFVQRGMAAVTVVAEAGIGKSRLLAEFEAWSREWPAALHVMRGRAHPHTQGQPYGLLRDIIAGRLQIADDDTLAAAKDKLEQGVSPLFAPDDGDDLAQAHAHVLGHLIGLDYSDSRHVRGIQGDPRQIRNRAFHAAAQIFRRVSGADGAPVVLQLEDLHWADDASLDFLNYLAQVNRDVPMLILGFARPTLFERRTEWQSTEGIHLRIDLGPLDKGHSRDLVRELLKKLPEIPAALRELVSGGAEGNPFYMEELVKMLIDQGAIETHGAQSQRWTLHADKLLTTLVPPTLTGVLQARLDGLPRLEKLALQEASVIGHVFWDQALIALDEQAREALPALVRRELAQPRGDAAIDGLLEFAFRHQLLHQVTYNTVLKRTRRELHGRLAHWLSALTGARAQDFLGLTAEHYERAGLSASAAEYHARAAEQARDRYAHEAALGHVQSAWALLESLPQGRAPDDAAVGGCDGRAALELRWRLLNVRQQTHEVLGRRAQEREDIEALMLLAESLDDDRRRADAALRRSRHETSGADWPAGERWAEQSMMLATSAADQPLRLWALRRLARVRARLGDPASGKALALQGLADARRLGLRIHESGLLNTLMLIAEQEGDPVLSLALTRQSMAIDLEIGDRSCLAVETGNLGCGALHLGDLGQAQFNLEEALRLVRTVGDRRGECQPLCDLSTVIRWLGDDARALALARSALDTAVSVEAREWATFALLGLGEADLALGRDAAAAQSFEQALALAREIDSPEQHSAAAGLARVALARAGPQADAASALRQVEPVLAHVAAGGTLIGTTWPGLVELTCHQALARAGDARAADWLERAHARLQAQAAAIADEALRQGFLNNIPHHREIAALWQARPPAAG